MGMAKTEGYLGPYKVEMHTRHAIVHIPSRTREGRSYAVIVTRSTITCGCEAAAFRQSCWHVDAVRFLIVSEYVSNKGE
jgi:hypothetical protein